MPQIEKISQGEYPLVGANIRRLRKKNKLRNIDVIAKLQLRGVEISSSTFSKVERGTSNPSVSMLIALTEIFRCDFNAFFQEDEENQSVYRKRSELYYM